MNNDNIDNEACKCKKECNTCQHCGDMFRGYGDNCYDPCDGCKENNYKNYKKKIVN